MRSDHLSKHMKTHGKVENVENSQIVSKEAMEFQENDSPLTMATESDMGLEYESDDESCSDISDSEIASTGASSVILQS